MGTSRWYLAYSARLTTENASLGTAPVHQARQRYMDIGPPTRAARVRKDDDDDDDDEEDDDEEEEGEVKGKPFAPSPFLSSSTAEGHATRASATQTRNSPR